MRKSYIKNDYDTTKKMKNKKEMHGEKAAFCQYFRDDKSLYQCPLMLEPRQKLLGTMLCCLHLRLKLVEWMWERLAKHEWI